MSMFNLKKKGSRKSYFRALAQDGANGTEVSMSEVIELKPTTTPDELADQLVPIFRKVMDTVIDDTARKIKCNKLELERKVLDAMVEANLVAASKAYIVPKRELPPA